MIGASFCTRTAGRREESRRPEASCLPTPALMPAGANSAHRPAQTAVTTTAVPPSCLQSFLPLWWSPPSEPGTEQAVGEV